jgi:hypothetical protein
MTAMPIQKESVREKPWKLEKSARRRSEPAPMQTAAQRSQVSRMQKMIKAGIEARF